MFLLRNDPELAPATPKDALEFSKNAGWGVRGTTLVDNELLGRNTYFGGDEVGTMLLSRGFVIRAINRHEFAQELPAVIESVP